MRIPLAKERKKGNLPIWGDPYFLVNLPSGYSRYISTQSVNPFFSPSFSFSLSLDDAVSLTIVYSRPRPLVSHFDKRRSVYGRSRHLIIQCSSLESSKVVCSDSKFWYFTKSAIHNSRLLKVLWIRLFRWFLCQNTPLYLFR